MVAPLHLLDSTGSLEADFHRVNFKLQADKARGPWSGSRLVKNTVADAGTNVVELKR